MWNRFMRIMVFFDLPVKTKKQKKHYCDFRKFLINDGYLMPHGQESRRCAEARSPDKSQPSPGRLRAGDDRDGKAVRRHGNISRAEMARRISA